MPLFMSSDTGAATGTPVNDAYGTLTQTAGTAIVRVVPPRVNQRAKVSGFSYRTGATEHAVVFMISHDEIACGSEAASGQAVITFDRIPTMLDGSLLAANDYVIYQTEDGVWNSGVVSSLSGLAVTLTANVAGKVLKGARIFAMGVAGDHPNRSYTIPASTTRTFTGGDSKLGFCTAQKDNSPILAYSANGTNAGFLEWLSYTYGAA